MNPIAPPQETQIRWSTTDRRSSLSLTQLEDLGEALLDFSEPADLVTWLESNHSS
jgi:hypothetical protein